jgi:Zn ribbon nucleic-acid-binding protein
MSLDQFLDRYGDQEKCELALEKSRWPQGFECPHCSAKTYYVVWHGKAKTLQCCACRHQSTLTGGTVFHSSKLPLTAFGLSAAFAFGTRSLQHKI